MSDVPAGPEMIPAKSPMAVAHAHNAESTARPPNIVLLLGDDHGWPYFGFMGSPIVKTPHLDSLAERGVVFTRAHSTSSVCLPTLNSMLTGLYPYQYELAGKIRDRDILHSDKEQEFTRQMVLRDPIVLPRALAAKGYVSFEGGKLWNVTYDEAGFTDGMTRKEGDKSGIHPLNVAAGAEGLVLGRVTNQPVYDFVDREADRPFFIWYAPMLPHNPIDPPQKYVDLYKDRSDLSESAKKYYANCTRFDDAAGQLLDYLGARDLLQNTIIIYFNDNGWEQAPSIEHTGDVFGSALGGDRGKLSMHEFGVRTPIIVAGPGVVGGRRSEGLVSQVDLYATILDYAGISLPERCDGRSLRKSVEGGAFFSRDAIVGSMIQVRVNPERPATGENPWANSESAFCITTDRWHLIDYEMRSVVELYDTSADPEERTNVAPTHPDVVKELKAQIAAWKSSVGAKSIEISTK